MSRTEAIRGEFADFIPSRLENGVLYISKKYRTASHLCCCGCGNKVVTPLKPGGWAVTSRNGAVSLSPSIGNWSFPCKSHYWITDNRIEWARTWTQQEINSVRYSDQRAREAHFDTPPAREGFWRRILKWLFG